MFDSVSLLSVMTTSEFFLSQFEYSTTPYRVERAKHLVCVVKIIEDVRPFVDKVDCLKLRHQFVERLFWKLSHPCHEDVSCFIP